MYNFRIFPDSFVMCGLSQDCQVFRTFPAVFFLSPSQYIFLCLIPGDTILPSEEYIFGIYLLEYLCFLRTAEELHTGEVKSLLPNLSHLRCIYLLEYLGL